MNPSEIRSPYDPMHSLPGLQTVTETEIRTAARIKAPGRSGRNMPGLSPVVANPNPKRRTTPQRRRL